MARDPLVADPAVLARPRLGAAAIRWALRLAWRMLGDLFAARGRVYKLTFFTHNFMDACQLDGERIDACVFMAMTQDAGDQLASRQPPCGGVAVAGLHGGR